MIDIKPIREYFNLKQEEMANILGIKRSTYASYETRDTIPIKHLNNLANSFDISIDFILGLTSLKNYPHSRKTINNDLFKVRIKELRKQYKITQTNMANILNTSRSTWTGYEDGNKQINTLFLYDIACKYHTSIDYLLGKVDKNYLKP